MRTNSWLLPKQYGWFSGLQFYSHATVQLSKNMSFEESPNTKWKRSCSATYNVWNFQHMLCNSGMHRVWPSGLDSNDLECRSSQRKIKLTSKCYVDLFEALDFAHFKEHFLERTGLYQKHSSILESRYTSEKCCRRSSGEADDHTVQQEWAGLPRFSKFRSIMTSTWSYK